jgi:hypothetical protein
MGKLSLMCSSQTYLIWHRAMVAKTVFAKEFAGLVWRRKGFA